MLIKLVRVSYCGLITLPYSAVLGWNFSFHLHNEQQFSPFLKKFSLEQNVGERWQATRCKIHSFLSLGTGGIECCSALCKNNLPDLLELFTKQNLCTMAAEALHQQSHPKRFVYILRVWRWEPTFLLWTRKFCESIILISIKIRRVNTAFDVRQTLSWGSTLFCLPVASIYLKFIIFHCRAWISGGEKFFNHN